MDKDTLQAASRRLTIWSYTDGGQIREAAAWIWPAFEAEIGARIDVPDGWLIRLHSASGRIPEQGLFLFYRRGEIKVANTAAVGWPLWRAGSNAVLRKNRENTC